MSDELKTLFKQSTIENSGDSVAQNNDDNIKTVLYYHSETKHNFNRFARSRGFMDWSTQPDPFRRYAGAQTIDLPFMQADESAAYDQLFERQITPKQVSIATIGQLFELSLGLSAWKEFHDSRWALRVNPSSGNLHPTEGYLIGPIDLQQTPMICHYAPKDHCLEVRSTPSQELWNELMAGFPAGSFLVGLSSIHWREAWKYGERAFRYCQHDIGHALAALRISAAVVGWRLVTLEDLGDNDVARISGLDRDQDYADAEREHPDVLAVVIPTSEHLTIPLSLPAAGINKIAEGNWFGRANKLSPDHYPWPIIDQIADATFKPRTASPATHILAAIAEKSPAEIPQNSGELSAQAIILQRRSAVAFDGLTEIPARDFYRMLKRTMPLQDATGTRAIPFDSVNWPIGIHLCLFVHRVRELLPGLYILVRNIDLVDALRDEMRDDFLWETPPECPSDLPLYFLAEGNCQRIAGEVSCGQDIAGDSAFSLGMIAEFEHSLHTIGPWHYRRLFWEAGVVGQVLYLEAEALGMRATGIGCYFDDPVHDLFGFKDWKYQSLYHFTVGGPVEDTRLTTRPPYSEEQRKRNSFVKLDR